MQGLELLSLHAQSFRISFVRIDHVGSTCIGGGHRGVAQDGITSIEVGFGTKRSCIGGGYRGVAQDGMTSIVVGFGTNGSDGHCITSLHKMRLSADVE